MDVNELAHDVAKLAREATYVVVGLGVLGFQRAQVERRQLQKRAADAAADQRIADLRAALSSGVSSGLSAGAASLRDVDLRDLRAAFSTGVLRLDGLIEGASQLVDTALDPLEQQLPPAARDVTHKAREQANAVRIHIRDVVIAVA